MTTEDNSRSASTRLSTPVSSVMSIDNQNMFLYKDLPLPFRRTLTVTGICSIVFGLSSIVSEGIGLDNGGHFSGGSFISGTFSFYAGILVVVLCRQQIYVLKSLLPLIIIQLLLVLATEIVHCLIVGSSYRLKCELNDFFTEEIVKRCEKERTLAILTITVNLLLLVSIIFNLVIAIREWCARKQADFGSSSNSYLLTNIPLSLRENLKKTGIAYILLGLAIIGLDVGLLLNRYPFSIYTGFISGFFSVVYGVVLIILSSKRIYVLTSLFSLALWQLLVLSITFIIVCISFNIFPCSTQMSPSDEKCRIARGIAIISLITVGFSFAMTVMNMVFIVRGRREQPYGELRFHALD